ncbi:MAG TPA: hypothetical protein VHU23_17005 [Rhizomicrobium sp.]|jgi:hypothetical protein|nr:hypothetical protein [Rhizomicrobium sp.]
MKLLLRRDQRSGLLGKIIFALEVRAELSDDERQAISKYKLGDTVLYEKSTIIDPGRGLLGLASRLAHKAMNISVSVRDLTNGKKLECKDIVEMLAVEEQLREAGKTFSAILIAAQRFGGEEVIDLAA